MRVVMTLRPGMRATKKLVHLLGDRLVAVRYRMNGGEGRVRTAEIILDTPFLTALRSALAGPTPAEEDRAVGKGEPELRSPLDDVLAVEAPEPTAPCACSALLRTDAGPRLTFVFATTDTGAVLASVDELPAVWATGPTIDDARASLVVEVSLVLAANSIRDRAHIRVTEFLMREAVLLRLRRS